MSLFRLDPITAGGVGVLIAILASAVLFVLRVAKSLPTVQQASDPIGLTGCRVRCSACS